MRYYVHTLCLLYSSLLHFASKVKNDVNFINFGKFILLYYNYEVRKVLKDRFRVDFIAFDCDIKDEEN